MQRPHQSVAQLEQGRDHKNVDKVVEVGNRRFVFEKRLNHSGQNQVIEREDNEYRQSKKPDQPAGLFPGVFLTVKKVHRLPSACSTRPGAVKCFTAGWPSSVRELREDLVGFLQRFL